MMPKTISKANSSPICIYGEVLFDHFPDGSRVLGGAPFNVAWHLQAFGLATRLISCLGDDPEAQQILQAMQGWGISTADMQCDPELPTGRVEVSLHEGEPSYQIITPCAYDRIQPPQHAPDCGWLYHGTLALRDPVSRASLNTLLEEQQLNVFLDVNLRRPWWDKQDTFVLLQRAQWVKLNTEELQLLSAPEHAADPHKLAEQFLRHHQLQGLILTHGSQGAEVITHTGEHHQVVPQAQLPVVDTVGAGDAFASVMLLGLTRGWPLDLTLQRAQQFASAQVGQRGATVNDPAHYQLFIAQWS